MVESLEPESWGEYRKLVISALERLDNSLVSLGRKIDEYRDDGHSGIALLREDNRREMAAMMERIVKLEIDFGMQRVRTGLLGAAAGSIPSIIAAVVWYLVSKH